MVDSSGQLVLDVALADHATFDSFEAGGSREAVHALKHVCELPATTLWLYGVAGAGKSHLLQALCASRSDAAYLPCIEVRELSPVVFDGFERFAVVCLDDVEVLLGARHWEESLFSLYTRLNEVGSHLVCSAASPPRAMEYEYADLRSRLCAATVFPVHTLDDEQCMRALQTRARLRGLELPDEVARFWLRRQRRDMTSLCQQLDQLDHASLVAKRPLTIPFLRSVLPSGEGAQHRHHDAEEND